MEVPTRLPIGTLISLFDQGQLPAPPGIVSLGILSDGAGRVLPQRFAVLTGCYTGNLFESPIEATQRIET
jgi:hypothetical protein